jgi:hypothetical protein
LIAGVAGALLVLIVGKVLARSAASNPRYPVTKHCD